MMCVSLTFHCLSFRPHLVSFSHGLHHQVSMLFPWERKKFRQKSVIIHLRTAWVLLTTTVKSSGDENWKARIDETEVMTTFLVISKEGTLRWSWRRRPNELSHLSPVETSKLMSHLSLFFYTTSRFEGFTERKLKIYRGSIKRQYFVYVPDQIRVKRKSEKRKITEERKNQGRFVWRRECFFSRQLTG